MSNNGNSVFGAATGNKVCIMNMADCVVDEGVIVKEWLARDNYALVQQLGFDVRECARNIADNFSDELRSWFQSETIRLHESMPVDEDVGDIDFQSVLSAQWISGDDTILSEAYPHYAVLHRSPVEVLSGRRAILAHFAKLRSAFLIDCASVDHVCRQSMGDSYECVAIRWTLCGRHEGEYLDLNPKSKPMFVMGVTHRRIVNGRIAAEWTVFDRLALLAQLL